MPAETLATILILGSALLHAVVNALVKISDDGLLTRGCMNAVALAVALPFVPFVPAPDETLWPLLISAVLVHGLYPFFLASAYRQSDLGVAFPVALGIAPLGVALLVFLVLGAAPSFPCRLKRRFIRPLLPSPRLRFPCSKSTRAPLAISTGKTTSRGLTSKHYAHLADKTLAAAVMKLPSFAATSRAIIAEVGRARTA